jgi:hypothetical protein
VPRALDVCLIAITKGMHVGVSLAVRNETCTHCIVYVQILMHNSIMLLLKVMPKDIT